MRFRAGAMFLQDRTRDDLLDLGLLAVMEQGIFQGRMRRHLGHVQQQFRELTLDTRQFLQFGKIHILEAGDLHVRSSRWIRKLVVRSKGTAISVA